MNSSSGPGKHASKMAGRFGPGTAPRTRILMRLAPALAPALPFVGIALLVFMLLAAIVPSGQAGQQSGTEMLAYTAAETDGVDPQARAIYQEAGENSGVPWEVLAAIVEIHDNEPETDEQGPLSRREVGEARRNDTPVAPYDLLLTDAAKAARTYGGEPPVANRMNDLRAASAFAAGLLRAILAERDGGDTYALDAGLVLTEDEEGGSRLDYEGGKPNAEARRLARAYIGALGRMPVEDARGSAEATYTLAMAWHMGQVKGCDLSIANPVGTGGWANPAVGAISTHYGAGGHDGTDIDTPNDSAQPVVAASSGTVVTSADLRVGAIYVSYGRYIVIDHGGGIKTLYAHLSRRDVEAGATVSAGQQIGLEGTTGNSTGDHLHFEVFVGGVGTDPEPFMAERGVTLGVGSGGPITTGTGPVGGVGAGELRVVSANIKSGVPDATYRADLAKATAMGADLIALQEAVRKPHDVITPPGYASYRSMSNTALRETPVLWRTDRWTAISTGSRMTSVNSLHWGTRGVNWVTLRSAEGFVVSLVSVHNLTAGYPEKAARYKAYGQEMDALVDIVGDLSSRGAVILPGDYNIHYPRDKAERHANWPLSKYAAVNVVPGFDTLGAVPTGDKRGATIDYVWYQAGNGLTPTQQGTYEMNSDHKGLWTDFTLGQTTSTDGTSTGLTSWTGTSGAGEQMTLDEHQLAYASGIIAKAKEMTVSTDGAVIALMTVAVESRFQMYASSEYPGTLDAAHDAVGSDHDSVGLFQQRPISGWGPRVVVGPGSAADRNADALDLMDVGYSASAFFGGPSGPNRGSPRGLLDIPGWEAMAPGDAAQSVQVSAFPDRYAAWESAMRDLYAQIGGSAGPEACAGGYTGDASGGFTFATFNALGHGHTVPGGNKPSFPASDVRLAGAVEAWQAADVSVLALQEFQAQQRDLLLKDYGDTYDVFPRTGAHNSNVVAWRKSDWALVSGDTFPIPYFNGINAQMPYVLLQNEATSQRIYVISVHNPADARGPAQQWRDEAVQIEKNLATRLARRGHPVLLAGDFNDVDEAHCPLVPPMTSAFGAGTTAPCRAPEPAHIDQIFGAGALSFSSTTTDHAVEAKKISDHPLVTTRIEAGPTTTAIDFALAQVGDTYRLGATGPDTWDCSSLMQAAWRQVGVSLPRTSGAQSKTGKEIGREDLRPGDLIFYYSPVSHVAMYLGEVNGVPSVVHAINPDRGVLTSPLSEMEADIVGYRRVLTSGG